MARRISLIGPGLCGPCCLIALTAAWFLVGSGLKVSSTHAKDVDAIRSFLAILGTRTFIRTSAMPYALSLASAGSPRQMAGTVVMEVAITFLGAVPPGWIFGVSATLWGMVYAVMMSGLYAAWLGAQLMRTDRAALRMAPGTMIASQVLACLVWLSIVGRGFGRIHGP